MAPFPDDISDAAHRAAQDARHAARAARRAAHRARFRRTWGQTQWFFPTLLIALGTIFLLDNLNVIEARFVFRNIWPLLVLAFGLSRLFFGIGGERVFGAIATFFGGFWLADRLFDLDLNIVGLFWPLILIGLGISMLYGRRRWYNPPPPGVPPIPPSPGGPAPPAFFPGSPEAGQSTDSAQAAPDSVDQSARLKEVAVFSSIERRNISQVFRGGELTAVMGSVDIDLRDCRMADPTSAIVVQVVMGQVTLRLPSNWTLESHLGTFLGNLEDRSDRPVDPNPKRLILYGSAFMGQVEVRN